ncbi:MAG: bacterial transcriptional activator domain-containing protein, partial [Actinomycetota bacterium]
GPDGDAQFEATTAAVAIAAGDETSARRAALAAIEPGRRSLGGPAPGLSQLFPPAYVLDDDARAEYETAPLSGRWRDIRDAARALTSARAGRAVEWDSIDDVQIGPIVGALGLRWAAELACAAAASGRRTMADALFSGHGRRVRELVASLAESPTLGGAARQLLAELPTPPESPLEIRVLGPMELRIGSQTLHHADWRRERVRELLGLLVDRRRISRRAASATLWPDLDDRRAARNLAVTINYLNAVLEPHRPSGATAWFVRSDGPNVWLVDDDTVHIDAWEFERVLGERVDSAAAETTATVRALRMWGGDYLADLDRAEWAEAPRVRLRQRFVTAAVRVAELSAAIGQPADALEWAGKAIEADRWCEPAYVALATAQQQLGDRGGALRTLQRGEEALAELSLAPGAAAAELDRQLRAS